MLVAIGLLSAALCLGCTIGSGDRSEAATETVTVPSPEPSPSPAASESTEWGPLAVVDGASGSGRDGGLGPGVLRITEECVTLGDVTLVWRNSQTDWDSRSLEIAFDRGQRGSLTLLDGDILGLGGGTGLLPNEMAPWVARPEDSCPREVWYVHDVYP